MTDRQSARSLQRLLADQNWTAELVKEKIARAVSGRRWSVDHEAGPTDECTFIHQSPSNRDGKSYPKISFQTADTQLKVYLHHLLFWQSTGRVTWEGCEISHLCAQRVCVNPDHLVAEDHKTNQSRFCCKWAAANPRNVHDRAYPYRCPHTPACILDFNRAPISAPHD